VEDIGPRVKLISQVSSSQATGSVLLKTHATGLATDKSSSLLGILDQIEMKCRLVCSQFFGCGVHFQIATVLKGRKGSTLFFPMVW